jgi:release factor glutamine methyltransferase
MKLRDLLREGAEKLKAAGVETAEYDARQLLNYSYGKTSAQLLAEMDRDLCPGATGGTEPADIVSCPGDCGARITYNLVLARRAAREPLQHILGTAGFMGLDFHVDPSVLIPRQDTETLVETVLQEEKDPGITVLDLCTGSGCIAIALKKLGAYREVSASDIGKETLKTARSNARANQAPVSFLESDLFEKIPGKYDLIVSNPPYIPTGTIDTLEPEVRDHDPKAALDGGADGLEFYRRIISEAPQHLNHNGRIYLEIGYDQADAVRQMFQANGFEEVRVIRDLAGLDRVVRAKKGNTLARDRQNQ